MNRVRLRQFAWGFVFLVLISGACKKKTPPPPPPPPPPPAAAPTVSLSADPNTIQRGGTSTLSWSSQNATELNITPRIGTVQPSGSQAVSPAESTTYTITARGKGGSAEATARVTVTAPPPPVAERPQPSPPPPTPTVSLQEKFDRAVKDAYFDFDKADIRDDSRQNLTASAEFFRANPSVTFTIEGHCDERGSVAYNLGLGDRRANAAKDFLVSLGISGERIKTISYGKERPFCTDHDESCWQQNRRGHLVCENCGQ